jgi:hypothetical protein
MKTELGKEEPFIVQVLFGKSKNCAGSKNSDRSLSLVNIYLYQETKRLKLISIIY